MPRLFYGQHKQTVEQWLAGSPPVGLIGDSLWLTVAPFYRGTATTTGFRSIVAGGFVGPAVRSFGAVV